MNQQLLFFFSALGAFNGILVGLYFLFFAKPKHLSNTLLGGLFLALSVRVGKSVFFYFYDNIADAYIQFGLFACWLIGPLLYFYVKSALDFPSNLKRNAIVCISALGAFAIFINFLFPRSSNGELWAHSIIWVIYLQWLFFVILSGFVIYRNRKKVLKNSKNKTFKIWLLSIYFGNLIICLAFNLGNYTSYITGALSFSFVFYVLVLLLLFYRKREELLFLETRKYLSNTLHTKEVEAIKERLDFLVRNDNIYLNPNLSIKMVAESIQVSSLKLSQTLNEHFDTNFNDYINSFRIEAARKMIDEKKPLTIEAIAMDCGFNSKSTFYSAFKRHSGMTPAKYRDKRQKWDAGSK